MSARKGTQLLDIPHPKRIGIVAEHAKASFHPIAQLIVTAATSVVDTVSNVPNVTPLMPLR
jgi:hypothetical protein